MGNALDVIADDMRSASKALGPYVTGIARGAATPFLLATGSRWMSEDNKRASGLIPLEYLADVRSCEVRSIAQGVTAFFSGLGVVGYSIHAQDSRALVALAVTNAADYALSVYRRSRESNE